MVNMANMAANRMPVMAENMAPAVDMTDVDDLFGDGSSMMVQEDTVMDGLPMEMIHRPPPPMEMRMRLDQLKVRGCCQMIAWSRSGSVASISPDGKKVEIRYLRVDAETGDWALSELSILDLVYGLDNIPLVHLAWASTKNPELAVFDVLGRVTIISFSNLNHGIYSRKWVSDSLDDLNSVVGCHWLAPLPPARQYHILHGPVTRENGGESKYESSFVHAFPPYHPQPGQSALLCITDNGILKLFYPGSKSDKFEEISHELESIIMSEDQITHASICSDKNGLMTVIATASKQLRVIKIGIEWGLPNPQENISRLPTNPSLSEQHVAATTWYQGTNKSGSPVDHAMAKITHLKILASAMDPSVKKWCNGVIISVRSYAPSDPSPYHEPQSVIDRWEIIQAQQAPLQKAFENMGTRKPSDLPTSFHLKKLEPIIFNKVVINIHQTQMGRVLFITFTDGSVEYRNRFNMELMYTEPNYTRIHSLHEVGMTFENQSPCLNVAFSPTGCSMVQICNNKKIKWRKLHTEADIGSEIKTDPAYAAVVSGLTLAAGSAVHMQNSFEDVLAIAKNYTNKYNFTMDFVSEIYRMLKIQVDTIDENHYEGLFRNTHLQMLLSTIGHLGFHGQYNKQEFNSKLARTALKVRNVGVLVSVALNVPPHLRERLSPLDEPEVVDALTGCIKWAIDFIYWLLDSLFELLQDKDWMDFMNGTAKKHDGMGPDPKQEIRYLLLKRNNIAVHLLMSPSSRGYISAMLRRIKYMAGVSKKAFDFYSKQTVNLDDCLTLNLYRAYMRMQKLMDGCQLKFDDMERLLSSIGAEFKSCCRNMAATMCQQIRDSQVASKQSEQIMKTMQSKSEIFLLTLPHIKPLVVPAVKKLFLTELPIIRSKIDRQALFFHDYTLLEIQDSPQALKDRRARAMLVDIFKHTVLPSAKVLAHKKTVQGENFQGGPTGGLPVPVSSGKMRRCARCLMAMEDVFGHRPGLTHLLVSLRHCPCGGPWALTKRGETNI